MRLVPFILLAACGGSLVQSSKPEPLPPHSIRSLDTTPKERPQLIAQEAYLRAYLMWFGGLAPREVQNKARSENLFDTWDDYLASLGLPDYRIDVPRATQSNALMVATLSRLAEALCVRAAERDFAKTTSRDQRIVFTFDLKTEPTRDEFAQRFDVLHRLFLSYPSALAPKDRIDRYYNLYRNVAGRGARNGSPLGPDQTAWAVICTALVQHPEARLN